MAVYVNEHQVLVHYVIKLKYQLLGSQWLRPTAKHSVLFMWHKHVHRCSLMPTAVEYFNSVCVLYYQTSFLRLISYLIYSSGSLRMSFFLMMKTFSPPSSVVCSWLTLAFPIISRGTLYFRLTVEVHFMLPQRLWKGCPIKGLRWDDAGLLTQ